MASQVKHLSHEQVDQFLNEGYIVIKNAFTKEQAVEWTKTMWIRLGLDPADKSTWAGRERIHMPWHQRQEVRVFAPKAWHAIVDLLGGEERIDAESSSWGDSFIVNLGTDELESSHEKIHPRDLDNWHVDGDFFVHYLDSPEQALLVVPIFSDIVHDGGATMICPDGLDMIAKYLAVHPEGVVPTPRSFTPSTSTYSAHQDDPDHFSHLKAVKQCNKFVELTGQVGDVVLMHPLMLHSASKNYLRVPRVITNPPVALKSPFQFAREDVNDYSLVELKTLKAVGVDRLDFRITTERRKLVPERVSRQNKMLEDEKIRMAVSMLSIS